MNRAHGSPRRVPPSPVPITEEPPLKKLMSSDWMILVYTFLIILFFLGLVWVYVTWISPNKRRRSGSDPDLEGNSDGEEDGSDADPEGDEDPDGDENEDEDLSGDFETQ